MDAVRLVNNLAANSELSAVSFIREEGSVEALKVFTARPIAHTSSLPGQHPPLHAPQLT